MSGDCAIFCTQTKTRPVLFSKTLETHATQATRTLFRIRPWYRFCLAWSVIAGLVKVLHLWALITAQNTEMKRTAAYQCAPWRAPWGGISLQWSNRIACIGTAWSLKTVLSNVTRLLNETYILQVRKYIAGLELLVLSGKMTGLKKC